MMKAMMSRQSRAMTVALGLSLLSIGCGTTSSQAPSSTVAPTKGQVTVFLTDAPADNVVSLNLTITDAALLDASGKSYPLLASSRTFELRQLRLASALAVSLAATDPGTFNNVEIGLSTPRLTILGADGTIQQLTETTTPSVSLSNSSVTIPATFTLAAGQVKGLTLDFNVQSSLWIDANGNYQITPVMKSAATSPSGISELSMSLVKISAVQASSNSMDVQVPATGDSVHMKVDSNTSFDQAVGKFTSLQAGQMIEVEAKFQSDGTYLAKYINQGPPDPTLSFQGVLMNVNQTSSSPVMEVVVR